MSGRSVPDGLSSASPMEPQASPPEASIPSAIDWIPAPVMTAGVGWYERPIGRRPCPVCQKPVMHQGWLQLWSSGVGQHIRNCHPEMVDAFKDAALKHEADRKAAERAVKREAAARPLRMVTVSGAFLDEIAGTITGLIEMMESYYAQGNGADHAYDLLAKLETLASGIEAGTDETLQAAQPEGQEPGAGTADATPTSRGSK